MKSFKLYKLQVRLQRPSYFAMASIFIIGFAHLDRASTHHPIAKEELAKVASVEMVQKLQDTSPSLPSLEWDFFKPLWKDKSSWNLIPVSQRVEDTVTDPTWNAENLVNDPDHRVEPEFQVSASLKSRVVFWMNIFARYPSQIRVVHDRRNMGLIYGYIDLRPIYRIYGKTAQAETKAWRVENKVISLLKKKILEATGHSRVSSASDEELLTLKNFVTNAGAIDYKSTLELTENIRTQTGQRDSFLAASERAKNLLPHIESVFKRNNLPGSLAHIPFIESSFNVKAESKIGAMGIWQFTKETAREYIHADEEKMWADPLKQTQSATRLLRNYRSVLPDWGCAVTSYNSGIGRVRRLLDKHKLKNIEQLIAQENTTNGLGFAGKNFYAEFLAVTIIQAYKQEIFDHYIAPVDSLLVFKGKSVFPNQTCDL